MLEDLAYSAAGAVAFVLFEIQHWPWYYVAIWTVLIVAALELLSRLIMLGQPLYNSIPAKGKPLDTLEALDHTFIWCNKMLFTPIFTYHVIYFCWYSANVSWSKPTITNTLLPVIALYIVYDFFYTIFHKVLHLRGMYKYVHKHHHRQKAPHRGNTDAINVHPFEFVVGEYNHLLAIYLVSYFLPFHVLSVLLFILFGGILASLNHTRFDLKIMSLFQVKYHDIHHWYPYANFGQYTMFWDRVFGWFKDYPQETTKTQ